MKKESPPILEVEAFLWDGSLQLPGKLILGTKFLEFRSAGFKNSHMCLKIALKDMEKPEVFRIYDVALNGLRIKSKGGREDLFVVSELENFLSSLKKLQTTKYPP